MSDIFISYASEDRERAKQVAEVVTQQGWSVWWDHDIPPGKAWAQVIERQLEAASCVIVLWSSVSVASDWVNTEAREGKARGILIPILIEEARIPLEFRSIQAANLVGWDPQAPRPDLNVLLLALEGMLGKPKQPHDLVLPEQEREAVEALRQRLHALEKEAAPSRSWVPDAWARAERCGQEAEVAWQEQRYPDATRLFGLALRAYADAQSAAQDAQAQQEAHEAKAQAEQAEQDARSMIERERAKQEAEAKQSQVAIIRERASEAEVEKYASGAFREAVHTERRGDTALSQGEYVQARELYLTAQQRYAQAQQQAEMQRQRAREAVEALRQRLHALEKEAAPLRSWVPDAWTRAEQCGQEAEVAWQEQRYPDATRLFGLALRAYAEAHSTAQDAQTQQEAHEAQAQAEQAEMQRLRARAAAEAARERALVVQAEAQGGAAAEIFADQWAQAQTLLHEADTALSQDHDDTARAGFEKCAALFRHLYDQALVHIDQQQAEQARTHASGLQREIGDAKGWRLARAKRALARGHRLFESTNYSEARSSYEKAAALFTAWQQSAGVPWTKLYPALALGAIAIGVTVYVTVPDPKLPTPPPWPPTFTPSPAPGPLTLAEGAPQTFILKLEEPFSQPLRYTWFLDGIKQTQTQDWTYTPDFDAAAERFKELKVVIVDPRDRKAEVNWQIQVVNTNRPPRVAATTPAVQTLALDPGQTAQFAVQGSDPDRGDDLTYLWSLDGKQMGQGERWELTAEIPGSHHRLEVAIMDKAGLSDHRHWDIAVNATPRLRPLAIRAVSPKVGKGQELMLVEGRSQTFSIEVAGGDPAALEYVWQLDGKKQATGSRWSYKAPASASRIKELRVIVSGDEGRPVEYLWRIRVNPPNRPPVIVRFTPTDTRIEVARGTAQRFTVEATDADTSDPLAYSWLLDRRPLATGTAWDMGTKVAPRQHRVEVKVADKSGATATQQWTIIVSSKREPPVFVAPKPITEPEVQAWLDDRYKRAWDTRNVDDLVGLGVVTQSNAPKLRETLQTHREFQIRLKNVRSQIDGNEATVSFQKDDVIDGQPHPDPDPKVVVLSKHADGTIVGRFRR